tara:strand:+ start:534 stop:734 length:201 start_codon:yes stop_codon:yes gene_type:complete
MIPVQGHSSLARDPRSGAIVNISEGTEYSANKARMAAEELVKETRLDKVEQDVSEIKMMLKQLIER